MKLIVDANGFPKSILEEKDLGGINAIEDMIGGEFLCHKCGSKQKNIGWESLKNYLESEKIWLEKRLFDSLEMKSDEANTKWKLAVLNGFKHFLNMPDIIVKKAERLRQKMEAENGQSE